MSPAAGGYYGGWITSDGEWEEREITTSGGMCPECEVLGKVSSVDIDQLVYRSKSLNEGPIKLRRG